MPMACRFQLNDEHERYQTSSGRTLMSPALIAARDAYEPGFESDKGWARLQPINEL